MLYWRCHFPRHFAEFFMSEIPPSSNEKSSVLMNLQSLLLPVFCTDGITKEMRRLQTCLSWARGSRGQGSWWTSDIGLGDSSRKLKKLKMDRHADMPMLGKSLSVGQHDEVDLQQPNLSAGTTGTTRSAPVAVYKQCSFQSCCLVFKLFWSNVTISFQRSPLLTHLTKQLAFTSQSSAFFPTSSSNHVTSQQSKTTEKQPHYVTLCYAFITTLKKKNSQKTISLCIYYSPYIYIYRYILYIMFTYFCTNQFPNAKLQSTEVKVCTAGGRGSFSTISGSRSCIAESVSVVYPGSFLLNHPDGSVEHPS